MKKVLDFSKELILNSLNGENNYLAIDCTCGRGNDTLFLSKHFQNVVAFDIQNEAVESTNKLLSDNEITNVKVYNDSHENIKNYNFSNVQTVMFNLGYLPKGNKNITTNASSTIKAIENLLLILNIGGIITIVGYPGFDKGLEEINEVFSYLKSLDQKIYDVIRYDFINQINNPPFLLVIEKIKGNK